MNNDAEVLPELMLYAIQFADKAAGLLDDLPRNSERDEARLKLARGQNILELLQQSFNDNTLRIENPATRSEFRVLIIYLLWVSYYLRDAIDYRTYRVLIQLEAGFTNLLIARAQ